MQRLRNTPISYLSHVARALPNQPGPSVIIPLRIAAFGFILSMTLTAPAFLRVSEANTGTHTAPVYPMLECVTAMADGSYSALFGYKNENKASVTIPVGSNNKFSPSPINRGQTSVFKPGRIVGAFRVSFNGSNLAWTLQASGDDDNRRTATASSKSMRCANQPPNAVNDTASTVQGVAVTIPVLANDSDPEGAKLTIASVTSPAHGMTTVKADGTITYSPVPVFSGTDTFTYTISDGKGGTATASVSVTVLPDTVAPVITASENPVPNAAEWNNTDVTITFTCSDTASGVASCPPPATVTTDGTGQIISGTASDKAGNTKTITVLINLDKTPPVISGSALPTPNANGWNNTDVTVNFICTDATSGIATCPAPMTLTTEGANQSTDGTATDHAGNSALTHAVVNIDKNRPVIKITSPQPDAILNQSKPGILVEFSDGLSGIDISTVNLSLDGLDVTSDASITPAGLTYTPMTALRDSAHSIIVSASDKANNSGRSSTSFTTKTKVRPFLFPEPGFDSGSYSGGSDTYNGPIEVGDINRDGISDVVVSNHVSGAPLSKISVILGKGDGTFQNPITVGEINNGSYDDIAMEDFNSDGSLDLALTVILPNRQYELILFKGNGDGTFTMGMNFSINAPGRILTGKFDSGPYEDIAIADQNGDVILFHGNGDGSFSNPTTVWSGGASRTTDAVSSDFNHDGLTDIGLIVGDSSGGHEFLVLLNNGDGTFQPSTVIPWDDSFYLSDMTFGDLNGDGLSDILMLRDEPFNLRPDVVIFMNDGRGNFPVGRVYQPWLVIPTNNFSINGGRMARLSDLNGDQRSDLLISYFGKVFTFLGNGDGTFQPPSELSVSGGSLDVGDFDQDGAQDLVTVGLNHIFALFGRGDGGFIDREEIPTSTATYGLISADLDGDRTPDLVLPGTDTSTLFSTLLNRENSWIENNISPPFQSARTYRTGTGPVFVKMGDLNKDGHLDYVVANEQSNDVSVLINSGDGDLNAAGSYPVGSSPVFIALEDLNGDGYLDIVTANSGSNDVSILLGRGDGVFQAQKTFSAGPDPKSLAIADINGDGYPDIMVVDNDLSVNYVSILLGNGNGSFQPSYRRTTSGWSPVSIQEGDFNRDGLADFAVVNYTLSHSGGIDHSLVTLLLGKGDGTFDERIVIQPGNANFFNDILSRDLNRDGKQDLISIDYQASSALVFLNDGYGQFNQVQTLYGLDGSSVALGDLNQDGNIDLLAGGLSSLHTWLGQGDGTFFNAPAIGGWEDVSSIQIGDIDGDGAPDIALVDGQNLSVIPGSGHGIFLGDNVIQQEASDISPFMVAAADFNGDHNQDILITDEEREGSSSYGNTRAVIYWGTGDNVFRRGPILQTSTLSNGYVITGDFNEDGFVDFALGQNPGILIYINNGDGTFRAPAAFSTDNTGAGKLSAADINHDSHLDLIRLEYSPINNQFGQFSYNIVIYTGYGNGTFQYSSSVSLDPLVPTDVIVQDFNGDGLPDLAVSMDLGNTLRIYLNNGNGTFNSPMTSEVGIYQGGMTAQDFNHDGFMDLVIRDIESIYLLLGNGDGTFQPPIAYGLGETGSGVMVSKDFNLDGRMDIAAASGNSHVNLLLNLLSPLHTPPSPPKNLAGVAGDGSVSLSWTANPGADTAGYNLYRSLSSGGGYAKINTTLITSLSFIDASAANGQLYFYTAAAVDAQGAESSFSRKVKATPRSTDTTPPVVKITTPVNSEITVSPLLFVSGTIDDVDAKVTVNGMSAAVQTQNRTFTAYNIPLNAGLNTITVTAVDPAGNRSSDTVAVTYALVAEIKGMIQDASTGEPIQGAMVSIQDSDGTQIFSTEADGLYAFTRLIPGDVTVSVTTINYYQPYTVVKPLTAGQVLTLNIPLELRSAIMTGTVYDEYRPPSSRIFNPIAGATVMVTDHLKTQTAVTDSNGRYRIENIVPRDITIAASKAGYETQQGDLSVSPQQTLGIDFYLDKTPPAAPTGLVATPVVRGVGLKWNANTETDLKGYNVYRATTSGGDYSLLNATPVTSPSYNDGGLTGGTTYYYVVTAINTSERESDNSTEVAATTPSPTLPISITNPANGASINASSVIVTGTIDTTLKEIGVVIEVIGPNGIESVPAHVNRNTFSAMVPLQAGANTITAVAYDPKSDYGEAGITINALIPQEEVRLTANPESGVPDNTTGVLTVTLQVETTLTNHVNQYRWDFDGNGTIDQTGSGLTQITAQYQTVGIYYPTVTVIDTIGNTYTATTVVNVLSRDELDALLKQKWAGMRDALRQGNIEQAVSFFTFGSQGKYRQVFEAISNNLADEAANLPDVVLVTFYGTTVKYRIQRNVNINGQIQTLTFWVYFIQDTDGIWRIKQF